MLFLVTEVKNNIKHQLFYYFCSLFVNEDNKTPWVLACNYSGFLLTSGMVCSHKRGLKGNTKV